MKEPRIKKHPYFSMMYALRFPLHSLDAFLTHRSNIAETGPTCIINATYVGAS